MPRTARVTPKGHIYHVLTQGNNRQDIFEDEKDDLLRWRFCLDDG